MPLTPTTHPLPVRAALAQQSRSARDPNSDRLRPPVLVSRRPPVPSASKASRLLLRARSIYHRSVPTPRVYQPNHFCGHSTRTLSSLIHPEEAPGPPLAYSVHPVPQLRLALTESLSIQILPHSTLLRHDMRLRAGTSDALPRLRRAISLPGRAPLACGISLLDGVHLPQRQRKALSCSASSNLLASALLRPYG
ncbi:hypothetical protein PYCCODRAFT_862438 [Trametes coccinea BRFM310]|uniref:Uncharacterized protein n=1 Tax=Trametes coccinea (strain BRFM310) TaxID=1353009 RepID=A0A1Y2IDJ3_TRAC3|nr:hypothetical protein PYCCODRAFT_862438 [Trametes coccinea BRFM310]